MYDLCVPQRLALATNDTGTSFDATIVPTATKPTGTGKIDLQNLDFGIAVDGKVPHLIELMPFGSDANDETFDMRVYGWQKISEPGGTRDGIWVSRLLLDISCTLGNIAATALGTNNFHADTITVNDGAADNGDFRSLIDCQEDMPASVIICPRGCQILEFDFDMTGAASGNCLWRPVSHC